MTHDIDLENVKTLVESLIKDVFELRIQQAQEIHPAYAELWRAIEPMAMAAGKKRIRPYLTVVGYGKIDDAIIKVATAQELVHLAMLIHDDIIDKDLVRHGQKNVIGQYKDEYEKYLGAADAMHFANSAATLAGDAIMSEAYQLLNDAKIAQDVKELVTRQMGNSIYEVIAGELMDVEATFKQSSAYDPISIYRYKTASYSLVGPLVSGAYCARVNASTIKSLEKFAITVGIVFQVQDDLLGVYGDSDETGKSTTGDLKEGKRTLLSLHHEALMSDNQAERFKMYFGNHEATDEQFKILKQDMIESGAKAKTEDYINGCYSEINNQLENLVDESQKQNLSKFVLSLRDRRH